VNRGLPDVTPTGRIDAMWPDGGSVWIVAAGVLADIRGYLYLEGGRLPSEAQIAAQYGVSRATAGRVMWLLRWTGLVVGPAGGTARVAAEPSRTLALQLVERAYEIRRLNGGTCLFGADPDLERDCTFD
jgi:DNA-binding transcriptional MocR family regulator